MKRLAVLSVLVAVAAVAMAVVRAQPSPTEIRLEKVRDNLFIITGGRARPTEGGISGNTTLFVAESGVVLVDTKYPGFGNTILEQVRSVTSKPVTTIVNTHTHGDHTGSNGEFPAGVEFVAHENTRTNMRRMDQFKGNDAFVPKRTFSDRLSLRFGKDVVELHYFGRGHTDGDTVIVLPMLRTAIMGDLFARKWAPLIDANNGGSALAFPRTLARALTALKDVDTIITGHSTTTIGSGPATRFVRSSPLMKWADLQEYADFTRDFVAAAEAGLKAGKSVDEAVKGLRLPDKYKDYDMANLRADVQRVYDELTAARGKP